MQQRKSHLEEISVSPAKTQFPERAGRVRLCRMLMSAAFICLSLTGWCLVQAQDQKDAKKRTYSAVLDEMKIPRNRLTSQTRPVDLSAWPKDGAVYGPRPKRLTSEDAGLSLSQLPGVQKISLAKVKRMDVDKQRTGLFLVDIDFIPRELPEALKMQGLTLNSDGTLLMDGTQEPVVAFVTSEVYLMESQEKPYKNNHVMSYLLGESNSIFSPTATPANPFPFACFSFTPWALYHGGFHRWYEADTWVAAFGRDGSGRCSNASPHTRIDYLQTRAAVGWPGSVQHCFNCEQKHAHDEWDVGWFWPAHGIPTTTHSGVWADGNFSFSRTANLTW